MKAQLDRLLERFKTVADGGSVPSPSGLFTTYAISNFRGGIGKSTLAFNLAWEISRRNKTLLFDACPQCNFTQSLLGEDGAQATATIYDALLSRVMPGTQSVEPDELLISVPPACPPFK